MVGGQKWTSTHPNYATECMTRFTDLAVFDRFWCLVKVFCTMYSVHPLHSCFLFLNTFHFVGTFFVLKRYTDFDALWRYFVQCTSFTFMLYFVYKYAPFRGNALCPETIHRFWCVVKVFCTMYTLYIHAIFCF